MKCQRTHCQNPIRRDFLHAGLLSLMGVGLPDLLASEAAAGRARRDRQSARNVIMIWLAGGPSTIDMWDLKPRAAQRIRGEFKPISTSADNIQICEHLPQFAQQIHLCTLVRSVSHTIAEHGQGTEFVMTGNPINPALKYPSIGSVVSNQTTTQRDVPTYMELTGLEIGKAGYLGASYDPFVVEESAEQPQKSARDQFALASGFTVADLQRRAALLQRLEHGFGRFDDSSRAAEMSRFQRQAVDILSNGRTREALDISRESRKRREQYGPGLGRRALAARRLIEAAHRFVTIAAQGWDTHRNNFAQLRNNLLPQLDASLTALIQDLNSRGLLDETIVYCVGEFNRTPIINAQGGRDHWARAMSVIVAGGGLKRGFVYGSTDKSGFEPDVDPCSPTDVSATILNELGIAPDTVLVTKSGRPVPVFRDGRVLTDLLA